MGGVGPAIQQVGGALGQALQQRGEAKRFQEMFAPQQPQQAQDIGESEEFKTKFLDMIQGYQNETGTTLEPKELAFLWNSATNAAQSEAQQTAPGKYSMSQLAAISQKNPQLGALLQRDQLAREKMGFQEQRLAQAAELAREKMEFQEKQAERREKMDYLKLNEPEMIKAGDKLERLNEQKLELGRLNELFTTHADKMPSAFTAAMFNYKGEDFMSRLGRSMLSPEAQEALKILTGQIKGLNQTFRGRILEAEIKYYMRTWPELLNTPEGKMKIMRDIELMHEVQENVIEQTQKEIEDAGGKISYSEAHRRALRKTKPEFEEAKKLFIKPEEQAKALGPPPEGTVRMYIDSIGKMKNVPKDKVKEVEAAGGRVIR